METFLIYSLYALISILWIWATIDIIRSNFKGKNRSNVWFWIVLFFPVLGPIVYFQFKDKLFYVPPREFSPGFKHQKE